MVQPALLRLASNVRVCLQHLTCVKNAAAAQGTEFLLHRLVKTSVVAS